MTTPSNERIQALDVLRGFALCGIVFINIYQTLGMRELPTGLALFVQGRFYVIFSLLFGIGFAIFLERASSRSDRPRVLLVRRFVFLALLGGLHHLLQPGEVLLPYAICGLVFLLPFSYAPPVVNLVAGVVLLGAGIMFVGGAGLVPGLFLLGSALASYRVPEELPGRAGLLAALGGGFAAGSLLLWWLSPVIPGGPEIAALEVVQPLLMSGVYMTGVMLLLHTPLRAPLTAVLAPLGRTALTNYLLATVVFVAVGRAAGLEGSTRWGAAIALGAGILAAQAVLSSLWLRRFRYGPMEWLWRCATWWRWMPIRGQEVRATTSRCDHRQGKTGGGRSLMGWLRDRLARLGVRGPAGRDAVAAAVLAVLGLARVPVTLLVNAGRLPVPAWELAAANLASTADVGTIALLRRTPRTALALATAVVVVAAALPVRYAMTGLGVLVCAYTVATLLPWRRAAAVLGACALGHAAGAAAVTAAGGHGLVASQVTRRLIAEFARSTPLAPPPDELRGLTNRERDILQLVARGLSNAEIGERLSVSPSTVKTHVGSLLAKLGCRDRVQAVVYAYEHGVVTPGEDPTGPGADREEGRR